MIKFPVLHAEDEIILSFWDNPVIVVVGETGSGKTTQIPQILYRAGAHERGIIGVTEPRVDAAVNTSKFVAQQMSVTLGEEVGYQIRFDNTSQKDTCIKFMTDGILLREIQVDPDLKKYSVIVVDEAHERSENIDFLLGLLKDLLGRRDDLKVVVTSATIDHEKFSKYFFDAPVIEVSGMMYPVEVVYSDRVFEHDREIPDEVTSLVKEIHSGKKDGDILIFLTGQDQIIAVCDELDKLSDQGIMALPAYGAMSIEDRQKIFSPTPSGLRKVVVATNIAETSITIDGIVFVIDSGYIKQTNYKPSAGIELLEVVEHSRAGCNQRKGRAGRTRPGKCFRLYTEESFLSRPEYTTPEILRASLANVVLKMEDIGINPLTFNFLDSPDKATFEEAYSQLVALGAIHKEGTGLTKIGRRMAQLPLDASIARMILEAEKFGCTGDAIIFASLCDSHIFMRPRGKEFEADIAHAKFKNERSDALTLFKVWDAYVENNMAHAWCFENFVNAKALSQAYRTQQQLSQILRSNNIDISTMEDKAVVLKAIAAGFIYNLARNEMGYQYFAVTKDSWQQQFIHPGSSLFGRFFLPKFVVATRIMTTKKTYMRGVTEVRPEWLTELAPEMFKFGKTTIISVDEYDEYVRVKREVRFNEELIGNFETEMSFEETLVIQNEIIKKAEKDGLVKMTITKFDSIGYFDKKWYATDGVNVHEVHESYSSPFEIGDTWYFKKVESIYGKNIFSPVTRVYSLGTSVEVKMLPSAKSIEAENIIPETMYCGIPATHSLADLAVKFNAGK